jgi:tetratricopeptide (TPR) repeat protein
VNYRKFDRKYRDIIFGKGKGPELPVVVMASDSVKLPIEGGAKVENKPSPIADVWQRWNDYGIGLFLEGTDKGGQKGELKQAEPVFKKVVELGRAEGWVNLARVYQREGRIPDALAALEKASKHEKQTQPWTVAWLSAQIDERNGYLDEAIAKYQTVLDTKIPERGFDFSKDYEVRNAMGIAQLGRAKLLPVGSDERRAAMEEVIRTFRATLASDSENVSAHYNLGLAYADLARNVSPMNDTFPDPDGEAAKYLIDTWPLLADPKHDETNRSIRAGHMIRGIDRLMSTPRPRFGSRLSALQAVVEGLSAARQTEKSPAMRGQMDLVLAASHKALHSMYKPDETAEGRAQKLAREASPAANMNAQSIVIHPLHRPGAPGLEAPAKSAAAQVKTAPKREDSE